jgi:hypothetical protein
MRFVIVGSFGKKNNFGVLKTVKTKSDREQKHNAKIGDEEQFVPLAFRPGCKDLWLENSKMQFFFFKNSRSPSEHLVERIIPC